MRLKYCGLCPNEAKYKSYLFKDDIFLRYHCKKHYKESINRDKDYTFINLKNNKLLKKGTYWDKQEKECPWVHKKMKEKFIESLNNV